MSSSSSSSSRSGISIAIPSSLPGLEFLRCGSIAGIGAAPSVASACMIRNPQGASLSAGERAGRTGRASAGCGRDRAHVLLLWSPPERSGRQPVAGQTTRSR